MNSVSAKEAQSDAFFGEPELEGKVGKFDWHLPTLGMVGSYDNNAANLWNLDGDQWAKVQETTTSLRKQVGGFFASGGTFNNFKNDKMRAMVCIRDWITGVLQKMALRLHP